MQKIKKIHRVDPEKNVSQTDGQTDRWTGVISQDPYRKDGGSIMFSGNSRRKFS